MEGTARTTGRAETRSREALEPVATCPPEKYSPETCSRSGSPATRIGVFAPVRTFFPKTKASAPITRAVPPRLLRPNPERTKPGWTAFTVTPVPANRRASSRDRRMSSSFDRPYVRNPLYVRADCRSSRSSELPSWAADATFTTAPERRSEGDPGGTP